MPINTRVIRQKVRNKLLSFFLLRELILFLFGKKIYRINIDKKIKKLLDGKQILNNTKADNLIVSLTSFPDRIDEVKYMIYSILDQNLLPEKIILWLAESQFPAKERDLPSDLISLVKFGLDIRWCEDLRSYKKLIPAFECFPDYFIVTADDDIYYHKKWLQQIWDEHLRHTDEIICSVATKINFDINLPCKNWKVNNKSKKASFLNFPIGGGGILYHKKLLSPDVLNKKLFLDLSPYADDIWFYFMAILNNTRIRIVGSSFKGKFINPYREYNLNKQYKLSSINIDDNQNDVQFAKIKKYYNINPGLFIENAENH